MPLLPQFLESALAYSCDAPRHATPRAARRDRSRRRGEDKPRCDDDYSRCNEEDKRRVGALAPDAASHGTDADAAGLRPRDHHTSAAAGDLRRRRRRTSQKNVATKELARR